MKRILTALALLALTATTLASPGIRHAKISAKPAGSDPTVVGGPDWNADHVVDAPTLLGELNILRVTSDPNGTTPTVSGSLAWDTTNGQLWINTSGSTWTPFVRSDGGTAVGKGVIVFLGDSQLTSKGATTDNMSRQPNVFAPYTNATLDKIYAPASSEPIPVVDMNRGDLRIANVSTFPGFGPELSFGREIYDLLNGFGTTATVTNMPWIVSFAVDGMALKQMRKGSSYGTATPAFGGLNTYGAFVARVQAALATTGRHIGLLVSDLGPNDGANLTDANAVSANWIGLWGELQGDLGTGFPLILLNMHSGADAAFRPTTVRAQLAIAAAAIPGARLVDYSDLILNSDSLHLGSRRIWTLGGRIAAAARDQLGLLSRKSNLVAVRGYGEPEYEGTTQKPAAYPLSQDGDVQLYMVGSMKNSGGYTAIPTPTVPASGWTSLGNVTQAFGGQTQGAALFMRQLSQADIDTNGKIPPGAQILLSNDENYGKLFTLFGPWRFPVIDGSVVSFTTASFSNSAVNAPGVTTTQPNSLVVICFISQGGGPAVSEHYTVANSNLANLTIVSDEPYGLTTGNFGILVCAAGTKVVAGATGNTTLTPTPGSVNAAPSGFTVAFKAA